MTVLAGLSTVCGLRNADSFILPEPSQPEPPQCTSYSQLCSLSYNLTETRYPQTVTNSEQQLCRCTGDQTCEAGPTGSRNTITKGFKLAGHDINVKMTYCTLNQPARVCRKNEEALIMRGRGAFVFEIEQDFSCRCYRELYEHRSWTEGAYMYFAYSCGKPRCRENNEPNTECGSVRYDGREGQYRMDYRCRCLHNQECQAFQLPTQIIRITRKTCQSASDLNGIFHQDFRRKRSDDN